MLSSTGLMSPAPPSTGRTPVKWPPPSNLLTPLTPAGATKAARDFLRLTFTGLPGPPSDISFSDDGESFKKFPKSWVVDAAAAVDKCGLLRVCLFYDDQAKALHLGIKASKTPSPMIEVDGSNLGWFDFGVVGLRLRF